MNATAMAPIPPLDFWRSHAVQLRRDGRPHAPDARRLVKLIDLHRHLTRQAGGLDGALAEGLAASLLPAIKAAAGRLRHDG